MGYRNPKQNALMVAPVPFSLCFIIIFGVLMKGEQPMFVTFLAIFFGTKFLYWLLIRGRLDVIIEKFDKDSQKKKDRDTSIIWLLFLTTIVVFFAILFITKP